jgi:hypothetical protein
MPADEGELLARLDAVALEVDVGKVVRMLELDPSYVGPRLPCVNHEGQRAGGRSSGTPDEEKASAGTALQPRQDRRAGRAGEGSVVGYVPRPAPADLEEEPALGRGRGRAERFPCVERCLRAARNGHSLVTTQMS